MTDTYNQLKQELSVLYPDVTDKELNQMTDNLIKFFALSAKIAYQTKKSQTNLYTSTTLGPK